MIAHDLPAIFKLAEHQRELPIDIAGSSFQEPFSQYKIIVAAERFYLHNIESKLAHGGGIRVMFSVIFQCFLPAIGDAALAHKK